MTSHELAHKLLAGPDLPVLIDDPEADRWDYATVRWTHIHSDSTCDVLDTERSYQSVMPFREACPNGAVVIG